MFEEVQHDLVSFNLLTLIQAFDLFYLYLFGILLSCLIILVEFIFSKFDKQLLFSSKVDVVPISWVNHNSYNLKMKLY